ncbi:hypothetical protein [Streptomyces bobili]|uniref:hypothetical protein n=1 Tax=Streptomyces bobili TaxID=67280 RepID=UPI000A3BC403|nr:hypothetical protein [Streptomyces bobili]
MSQTTDTDMSLLTRKLRAETSGGRAAGYCWLEHPDGKARCTRQPHTGSEHIDYYTGRPSLTSVKGVEWTE